MNRSKVAVLFPGQGAFFAGALKESSLAYPLIRKVFAEVDSVAQAKLSQSVSEKLWHPQPLGIDQWLKDSPDLLQLAIYGISVATFRVLASQGLRPDVLMGHSFGEIAALVCAGSFTVAEGAEIIFERTAALAKLGSAEGYMAALGTDVSTAGALITLVGNHEAVIAGENHQGQTVLSGSKPKMDTLGDLARILRLPFVKLNSPYPFHSPLMSPVVVEFAAAIRRFTAMRPEVPVFSPIMQRHYQPADVLTDCLADHLIRPVKFGTALQQLYKEGVGIFIECGALDALSRITAKAVSATDVVTVPCLHQEAGDLASLRDALARLKELGVIAGDGSGRELAAPTAPGSADGSFDLFWTQHGDRFKTYARAEFEAFWQKFRASADHHRADAIPVQQVAEPPSVEQNDGLGSANSLSREQLSKELVSIYAQALEYPEEVFTESADLEAELGVDSVKQTELLARVSDQYHLPPKPSDFRLNAYNTMGRITDFIYGNMQTGAAIAPVAPMSRAGHGLSEGALPPSPYIETGPAELRVV